MTDRRVKGSGDREHIVEVERRYEECVGAELIGSGDSEFFGESQHRES